MSLFPEDDAARAEAERAELERLRAERAHLAEHDADFTPPDVCRLGCLALRQIAGLRPGRILGPCAGAGPWLVAAREFWPDAELAAMDIRAEELPHLEHHVGAANVRIGDFMSTEPPGKAPDLVLENLPFRSALPVMERGLEVLAPQGHAAWFVRMTLGDADAVNAFFERHPFAWQFEFVDRFKFRVGINPETGKPWSVDNVGYKLIVFERDRKPYTYLGRRLPSLPPASRRWRKTLSTGLDIRPGTEYLHGADVEAPATLGLGGKLWPAR